MVAQTCFSGLRLEFPHSWERGLPARISHLGERAGSPRSQEKPAAGAERSSAMGGISAPAKRRASLSASPGHERRSIPYREAENAELRSAPASHLTKQLFQGPNVIGEVGFVSSPSAHISDTPGRRRAGADSVLWSLRSPKGLTPQLRFISGNSKLSGSVPFCRSICSRP